MRTVLGPFSWDERGVPMDRPFLVAQWQGGELKFVFPTDEFEGVADLHLSEARDGERPRQAAAARIRERRGARAAPPSIAR